MEGQWPWIGGPNAGFATPYWCGEVVPAYWGMDQQGIHWGSLVPHAAAVSSELVAAHQEYGSSWVMLPPGKCGWDETGGSASAAMVPVITLATHAFSAPPEVHHATNFFNSHSSSSSSILSSSSRSSSDASLQHSDEFSLLPDDLLEKIFAALPLLSLFRARAVCKRWNLVTTSKSFQALCGQVTTHKPWYLMYKDSENLAGVAFDPTSRKWHNFVLPSLDPSASCVASAGGLACFLDKNNSDVAYVCNPMTKAWRKLPKPPDSLSSDYCAVAMCVDSVGYKIVVARSTPVTNDYAQWSLSIEVYDSSAGTWKSPRSKLLHGWRPGDESTLCNGTFYCVTHSTVGAGHDYSRHGLIAYDIVRGVFQDMILPMPCSLSCVRLVNCWGRLVMVGGIGTYDFIKGVGVWELETEWKQVSKMPTKQFHGFTGGLDDVFSCSGHGDLIYIHSYGSPQLMVFDIPQSSWTWARACPVLKRDPLHLFTGFCFQPRLDMLV